MRRALLLLFLLACTTIPTVTFYNGASFEVELAKTPAEKTQGLMFRDSMPENHGMFFLFDEESPRTFWMKNTKIPLDMLFLDKDMVVVEVKADIQPCAEDPCPSYPSKPAQYVLEINAGLAEKNNIVIGSKMSLSE